MSSADTEAALRQHLCTKCQLCCKLIAFPTIYEPTKDVRDLYETRGFQLHLDKKSGILFVYGEVPCSHLKEKGCDIYSKRPSACRSYDGRRDPVLADKCAWGKRSDKRMEGK